MQKDFHYFTIRILSEKAGFSPEESQIIAYASQFVDDSTEHTPMMLPVNFTIDYPRIKNNIFDPICTAHKGLQFLQDFKKDTQMQIYMCFHFLPSEIYYGQKDYSYVTRPNSNFAKVIIDKAAKNFTNSPENHLYNLINLGIAIHTYSDTWAHQDFSGTHSHKDNNIERIRIWQNERWQSLSRAGKFRNKLMPEIGHAEAFHYPDLPFMNWRFQRMKNKANITKNNLGIFIDAAQNVYSFLKTITKQGEDWSEFGGKLVQCLSNMENSLVKRCNFYRYSFPEIGFYYNPNTWKNEIFSVEKHALTKEIKRKDKSLKWFLFHKAAWEQRKFVLANIKPL